jgi:hypothetical protein
MLQGWRHNVATILLYHDCTCISDLLEQPCNKSDIIRQQGCYKLLTACFKLVDNYRNKQCEHNLLTACWQTCYKMWNVCVYGVTVVWSVLHAPTFYCSTTAISNRWLYRRMCAVLHFTVHRILYGNFIHGMN